MPALARLLKISDYVDSRVNNIIALMKNHRIEPRDGFDFRKVFLNRTMDASRSSSAAHTPLKNRNLTERQFHAGVPFSAFIYSVMAINVVVDELALTVEPGICYDSHKCVVFAATDNRRKKYAIVIKYSLKNEMQWSQKLGSSAVEILFQRELADGWRVQVLPWLEPVRVQVDPNSLIKDCVDILTDLQKCEMIHGDIKPDNLLFDPQENRVKLLDFDLATAAAETGPNYGGTFGFQAPEVLNNGLQSHKSDVFAAGKTIRTILGNDRWNQTDLHLKNVVDWMMQPDIVNRASADQLKVLVDRIVSRE